jgi:hypothetical protein
MESKFIQKILAEAKQGLVGDNIIITDKEKAKRLKTLHANTPEIVEMINALEEAGDEGLNSIQIAGALIKNINKLQNKKAETYVTVLRPKINSLIKSGIIARGGRGKDNTFIPLSKTKIPKGNFLDAMKDLKNEFFGERFKK